MSEDRLKLEPSWKAHVGYWFERPEMKALGEFLRAEKAKGKTIFPAGPEIFAALNATPFDEVKVVILGQDPYHGPNQAHGLCFSVHAGRAGRRRRWRTSSRRSSAISASRVRTTAA